MMAHYGELEENEKDKDFCEDECTAGPQRPTGCACE